MKKIKKCFIIDDDPIYIYGTKRIMKHIDFSNEVLVYNNGQDAIDALIEIDTNGGSLPEIIFLDLNMPIMNGWEFLERYKELKNPNFKKTIINIVSSSIDPRDTEKLKNYEQISHYILKPITPQDLEPFLK